MIHKLFSIYDNKAKAFLPPWASHQTGMATRSFAQAVNDQQHKFYFSPGDYALYQLAEFDDETGKIENAKTDLITQGANLKEYQNDTTLSDGAPILASTSSGNTT